MRDNGVLCSRADCNYAAVISPTKDVEAWKNKNKNRYKQSSHSRIGELQDVYKQGGADKRNMPINMHR